MPFIFDDLHFCRARVIGLDLTENRIFTLSRMIDIPPLPTSVQPISITKTLLIVPTKNERDPPLFTSKLLIKFQNIIKFEQFHSYQYNLQAFEKHRSLLSTFSMLRYLVVMYLCTIDIHR
jgi:hypothetical protein